MSGLPFSTAGRLLWVSGPFLLLVRSPLRSFHLHYRPVYRPWWTWRVGGNPALRSVALLTSRRRSAGLAPLCSYWGIAPTC